MVAERGCGGERRRPGKLFLPSGDRGEAEKGERGETAADRKAQLVARASGFGGPYGRQHCALRFIAHLAVLINGKPVHRAWSSSGCFPSSRCRPKLFLLHYTPALLTKSPKSGATLPGSRWKYLHSVVRQKKKTKRLLGNDDLIRQFWLLPVLF